MIYEEIFTETKHLRLIELDGIIEKTFKIINDTEEIQELKDIFNNENYKINRNIYPFKPFYEYMHNTIGIMEEWQCFCYKEDEEYEESEDYLLCNYIIDRRTKGLDTKKDIGRNDFCYCGSGKKYKKCCVNKDNNKYLIELGVIDAAVSKAQWFLKREQIEKANKLFRFAWFYAQKICKESNIKTIDEYDKIYEWYDSLTNWIQDYEEILELSDEETKLYERMQLYDIAETIFDLNQDSELYWKEQFIRGRANIQFKLRDEEKAKNTIESYLEQKPNWVWGYIEMADWYIDKSDEKNYDLEKAKNILIRCEQIENMEDMNAVYERLEDIYAELGDKEMAQKYNEKYYKYIHG